MTTKYELYFEAGDDGYCETCSSPYAMLVIEKWVDGKREGEAHIKYSSDLPQPDAEGNVTLKLPQLYDTFLIGKRQF